MPAHHDPGKAPRPPRELPARTIPAARYILGWWYGLMALGALAFGALGGRRPLGEGFFGHPLVAFFILVGIALIVLRIVLARPVPEVIPERPLLVGCLVALAAFLAGNFISVHLLAGTP